MTIDPEIHEQNRASTARIRALAARLSEADYARPVGEHWTVAIVFAHLAFWDRRCLLALDRTERDGKLAIPNVDVVVNDLSLPLWAAIPGPAAARLAIEAAEELDRRVEAYAPALLQEVLSYNRRWVIRALHRNEHLAEAEAALA